MDEFGEIGRWEVDVMSSSLAVRYTSEPSILFPLSGVTAC